MRAAGLQLTTMQEAGYPQDVEDTAWIPEVAAKGWVILTKDRNIRRRNLELLAVLNCGAKFFTLGKAHYTAKAMADIFLYHRSTIDRLCVHRAPPVVAQVNKAEVLVRDKDGELRRVKRRGQ